MSQEVMTQINLCDSQIGFRVTDITVGWDDYSHTGDDEDSKWGNAIEITLEQQDMGRIVVSLDEWKQICAKIDDKIPEMMAKAGSILNLIAEMRQRENSKAEKAA